MSLQQQLDEALAARHALIIGKAAVTVGYGERRIEYSAARLADLDSYIADLRRQITGAKRVRNRISYLVPGG